MTIDTPPPRRSEFTEKTHGYKILDPYRWMEDNESPETEEYINIQNDAADKWLVTDTISSVAQKVKRNFPGHNYSEPRLYGKYWWWKKEEVDVTESGAQKTTFVRSLKYDDHTPQVVIDMDVFPDKSSVDFWGADPTGRYWVGGVQSNGSDWQSVRIYDADENKFLQETLEDVKFTFVYTFTPGGEGFFYHILPSTDHESAGPYGSNMLYFHRLHTPQSDDICVWKNSTQDMYIPGGECISDDGKWVIYSIANGTDPLSFLYYTDVESVLKGTHKPNPIDDSFTFFYEYIGTFNDKWLFFTNRNADDESRPAGRFNIVSWTEAEGFKTVVAEQPDSLKFATAVGDNMMLVYMHDAIDKLVIWSKGGSTQVVKNDASSASLLSIRGSRHHHEAFAQLQSYHAPPHVYKINSLTGEMAKLDSNGDGTDDDFVTERQSFTSTDGQRIGLFVSYYKSKKTANPPVLLYAYGGFGGAEQPRYEAMWATFMRDFGGVLCVANIRGGGEYGLAWWEAARGVKRQVAFDDFKSAARYIVSSGITTTNRLAINGMSNGGLLTGACTVQEPLLFGCVVCDVGIHDLPRFDQFTFGGLWKGEYGDPSHKEVYDRMLRLSPYANIKTQQYPPIMITTADHDDRVVPAHSLKFAAEMQHKNPNNVAPIVLRVYKGTGHLLGKTAAMIIHESSEKLEFIRQALGIELK